MSISFPIPITLTAESKAQLRKDIQAAWDLMPVPVGTRVCMLSTKSSWQKGQTGTVIVSSFSNGKAGQVGVILDDPSRTDYTEHTAFPGDYKVVTSPNN